MWGPDFEGSRLSSVDVFPRKLFGESLVRLDRRLHPMAGVGTAPDHERGEIVDLFDVTWLFHGDPQSPGS